ncbi:MAG TPA: 1-acyl-sn-glycerol-3-phosphate acyltransferase [Fimbriimonas sp.]|nr:1-acyl-sn-glycerol-3-phosphate acyltransferase [Fimbriimonas sp.]
MSQTRGLIGAGVRAMIRRSVRKRFHSVYWHQVGEIQQAPTVFYANHHGWMDGYLMFHLVEHLGIDCVDWIEEFDTFPLFAWAGGMRYPANDLIARAKTVKATIDLMRKGEKSLILFAEGVLHRPPEIWPLGRSMELLAKRVPGVQFVPVSIRYELSMHERPEAWLSVGAPHKFDSLEACRLRLVESLGRTSDPFKILVSGTHDVNERMSLKRFRK